MGGGQRRGERGAGQGAKPGIPAPPGWAAGLYRCQGGVGLVACAAGVAEALPGMETAAPDRTECSLMEETRAGNPLRDHFDKLSIAGGQLVIRDLPPGDYQLKQGDKSTMILISPGRA